MPQTLNPNTLWSGRAPLWSSSKSNTELDLSDPAARNYVELINIDEEDKEELNSFANYVELAPPVKEAVTEETKRVAEITADPHETTADPHETTADPHETTADPHETASDPHATSTSTITTYERTEVPVGGDVGLLLPPDDDSPNIVTEGQDPGCGPIQKIRTPHVEGQSVYHSEREIRPIYTEKRSKNQKKFILDFVDSNGLTYAIKLGDCSVVSAIALTPSPETLTINSAKIINRYNTMSRWVEEHWGDDIDTITFSGGTFALFQLYDPNRTPGEGLTEVHRRQTEPYKMLKEVANIFRSNGLLYHDNKTYDSSALTEEFLNDPSNAYFVNNHPRKGLPKERLYVKMYFDYITCLGYLESFDVIEDSSTPFRLKYSLAFKAEKMIWNLGRTANSEIPVDPSVGTIVNNSGEEALARENAVLETNAVALTNNFKQSSNTGDAPILDNQVADDQDAAISAALGNA
jgi:hypothetical protein